MYIPNYLTTNLSTYLFIFRQLFLYILPCFHPNVIMIVFIHLTIQTLSILSPNASYFVTFRTIRIYQWTTLTILNHKTNEFSLNCINSNPKPWVFKYIYQKNGSKVSNSAFIEMMFSIQQLHSMDTSKKTISTNHTINVYLKLNIYKKIRSEVRIE